MLNEPDNGWLLELTEQVRGATVIDVRMHEHYAGNCGETAPGVWYGDVWVRLFFLCLSNDHILRMETYGERPWPRLVDRDDLIDTVSIADEVPIVGKKVEALGLGRHDRFFVLLQERTLVSLFAQFDGDWIDHGEMADYYQQLEDLRLV